MRFGTTTDPGKYQNSTPQEPSGENYRGKSDIRQPAGGIEFVNTKNEEIATFYYSGGAFLRFQKFSGDLFIPTAWQSHVYGNSFEVVNQNKVVHVDGTHENISLGDSQNKTGDVDKTQYHGEQWLKNMREIHDLKRRFEIKRCKVHNSIDQASGQEKRGTPAKCPTEQTSSKMLYTTQATIWVPAKKTSNNSNSLPNLTNGKSSYKEIINGTTGWACLTCGGDGHSPSSQDGIWERDESKDLISEKIVQLTKALADSEIHFGSSKTPQSGTEVRTSNKNIVEFVGSVFNTLESYRKDPVGKLVPYGIKVDPMGKSIYKQYRESPLIESVHVDPAPGGQYHLNVCDKYTLTVGANGIHMMTLGSMRVYAPQIDILSERTAINSRSELTLGGERVDISGEIITIRPTPRERTIEDGNGSPKNLPAYGGTRTKAEAQLLVDGNLNVSKNLICAGGAHIEGEMSVQHITAPCEYQITETDFEIGKQPRGRDGECDLVTLSVTGEEVEGEQSTEKDTTHADLLPGSWIGYNHELIYRTELARCPCCQAEHYHDIIFPCGLINIISRYAPNTIEVHPHYHYFKNIPLNLIRDEIEMDVTVGNASNRQTVDPNSAVRAVGARNNFNERNEPLMVSHSENNNSSIEKFTQMI